MLELLIGAPNLVDRLDQPPRTVVLQHVWLALEPAGGREGDVLGIAKQAILKGSDPLNGVLMHHIPPGMARHPADFRDTRRLADVDGDT